MSDEIIISYYINAFRNLPRTYEALLEKEPQKLDEAMKLTVKKEKIYSLIEENKPKTKSQTLNIKRTTNESLIQKANSGN